MRTTPGRPGPSHHHVALVSSSSGAPKSTQRTTILLVDDDPFQANAHRSALERSYASIERAADASDAFIRVEERGFRETLALVVVGLRLPGVAGPDFVSELKARLPEVPILVVGRRGETESEYRRVDAEFLPPGPSDSELLAAVRKILAKALRRVA